jgi:hypothetical protein
MKLLLLSLLTVSLTLATVPIAGQKTSGGKNMTASKIIETIIKSTGSPVIPDTVNGS